MSRVFFETGIIIEGPKNVVKRAIRRTLKYDGPTRYWFKLTPERSAIIKKYLED